MTIVPAANTQNRRIFNVLDMDFGLGEATRLFYGICRTLDAIVIQSNELFGLCQPKAGMRSVRKYSSWALVVVLGLPSGVKAESDSPILAASSPAVNRAFPVESLEQWREKSFSGNTSYTIQNEDGVKVLKASTINAASVLYRQDAIDLTTTPWLEWTWKIEATFASIDEKTKAGDDFPARLYVTAKTGPLPWQTIAINYVWSSHQAIDTVWVNPYTNKSIMVAVQAGNASAGQWVSQRRNVVEDFKNLFDIDVKQLAGYAVMVDGDNSSQTGTAYFGNIEFLTN